MKAKTTFTNKPRAAASIKIHAAGHSVKSWAEAHGFNVQTVRNVLNGQYRGLRGGKKKAIMDALIAEGHLPGE